jgi:hypothetical protein
VVESQDPALGKAGTVDRVLRTINPWAVIDLRGVAGALAAWCAERGVAYLMWAARAPAHVPADALIILTEPQVMSAGEAQAAPRDAASLFPGTARETLDAALDLLVDGEKGIWRLPLTW